MLAYITINKKSKIHGLWRDNGKNYFDKLSVRKVDYNLIEPLRVKYNQIAVFFTHNGKAFIKDEKAVTMLSHRKTLIIDHVPSKYLLYFILGEYNGLTIYKSHGRYIIAVYN